MEKDPSPSLKYIIRSLIYLSVLSLKFANLNVFSPYGHILGGFYPKVNLNFMDKSYLDLGVKYP